MMYRLLLKQHRSLAQPVTHETVRPFPEVETHVDVHTGMSFAREGGLSTTQYVAIKQSI